MLIALPPDTGIETPNGGVEPDRWRGKEKDDGGRR
jgi:hypothetical protein